jgi:CRISPR-associated protein Cas2
MAMNYVVAYDIAQNKRRRKISTYLQGWGNRVQESVFVCRISNEDMPEFIDMIDGLLDDEKDHLAIFKQCASCDKSSVILGEPLPVINDICLVSF